VTVAAKHRKRVRGEITLCRPTRSTSACTRSAPYATPTRSRPPIRLDRRFGRATPSAPYACTPQTSR
jgi:hypothetical protein